MPSLPTPPPFPASHPLSSLPPALSSSLWRLPSSSVYISSFLKFLNIRSIGSRSLGKNRVGRHEMSTVGTAVSPSPSSLPPSQPRPCPARRSAAPPPARKIHRLFQTRFIRISSRGRCRCPPAAPASSPSASPSPPLPPVRLRINYSISVCRCAPVPAAFRSRLRLAARTAMPRAMHVAS